MRIRKMNLFVRTITLDRVKGICLAPFGIYIRKEYLKEIHTVCHETIHWKQQMEMLIIFFYLWYFFEWFIRLFINGRKAYIMISFEREAYANMYEYTYPSKRKRFAWIRHL